MLARARQRVPLWPASSKTLDTEPLMGFPACGHRSLLEELSASCDTPQGEDSWKLVPGSPRLHPMCLFFLRFCFVFVHCSCGYNYMLSSGNLPTNSPLSKPGGGLGDPHTHGL